MELRPGVTYVTCPRCKGAGTVTAPLPAIPGARPLQDHVNALLTRLVLSLMLVVAAMIGVAVLGGVSGFEIARSSLEAGLAVLFVLVGGGFAVRWILRRLTTSTCPSCGGGGWIPGTPP